VPAAGAAGAHEGDRVAHHADGDRESSLGLQSDPGRVEEPRPPRREKYGRQGPEGQWDPARAGPAFVLAPFLRAHWGAIAGADFFTTEVWTPRGLVTYYTLFVLDLKSRRVQIVGSTRNPDAAFMVQAARRLTDAVDGFLAGHRVLICDRDSKWMEGFRSRLEGAGVRIVLTPVQAPNANAHAERFVRSIREECLDHLILFGERRLLHVLKEFVTHYHGERNHQGLGNDLIVPAPRGAGGARIGCRERLGGLLRYYYQAT
jgi:putative transposase